MTTLKHAGLKLFSELLDIPSPSGHEDRMAAFLLTRLETMGFSPELDGAGNVLVRLDGRDVAAPTICYAAHMDEIGMTVSEIAADGRLCVDRLGGLFSWKIGETAVTILGDRDDAHGMLSLGSGHSRKVVEAGPSWETARIFTGLTPQQLAERGIRLGAAVDSRPR